MPTPKEGRDWRLLLQNIRLCRNDDLKKHLKSCICLYNHSKKFKNNVLRKFLEVQYFIEKKLVPLQKRSPKVFSESFFHENRSDL